MSGELDIRIALLRIQQAQQLARRLEQVAAQLARLSVVVSEASRSILAIDLEEEPR